MFMLFKKGLAIMLIAATVLGIALSGCGVSNNSDKGEQNKQTTQETSQATETKEEAKKEAMLSTELSKPVKFTYLRPVWNPPTYQKGNDFEKELFKRANVEIEAQIVPVMDYEAKFPTLIAGGSKADVMWHAGPGWGVAYDVIQQGAFLPLDDLLEKYPAVKAAIPDATWDLVKSPDGKHYFFPNPLANYVPFPLFYRKDIFDQLGIATPTTIDELVAALKVIRDKKPDMVPITAQEYSLWLFQNVAVSFGYNFGWVPDPNDPNKIIPSDITPNYKEFLAFLQMLRREKLLDPDYMIAQNKRGSDKFNAGKAAVMSGNWVGYSDWLVELKKVEPNADVDIMPLLKGSHGVTACRALSGFDRGFSINSKSKDKADDIFKFLNWVYTDGYDFMKYGVENEMYKVDAEGNKVSIPSKERKPGYQDENCEPLRFPLKAEDSLPNQGQDWKTLYDIYKSRGQENKIDMVRKMFEEAANNNMPDWNRLTISKTGNEKGTQLWEQYTKPMAEKIVIDVNAPLDAFEKAVENWLKNGGQQIIDEVNAAQKDKSKPEYKYEYTGRDYRK
jgi:putative aldouronate transport system substrate-binding protein